MSLLRSDATVLQSILFGCGSSSITLNSILNTAISLGFALPTFVDLDGGLARLIEAGLIDFDGERVTPTEEALAIADEIMCREGSAEQFHSLLFERLSVFYVNPAAEGVHSTGWLSVPDYDQAFA